MLVINSGDYESKEKTNLGPFSKVLFWMLLQKRLSFLKMCSCTAHIISRYTYTVHTLRGNLQPLSILTLQTFPTTIEESDEVIVFRLAGPLVCSRVLHYWPHLAGHSVEKHSNSPNAMQQPHNPFRAPWYRIGSSATVANHSWPQNQSTAQTTMYILWTETLVGINDKYQSK